MNHGIKKCLMLLLLTAWGAQAPQTASTGDCLLFAADYDSTRCPIYKMDSEGNLSFLNEYHLNNVESINIAVSSDSRVVAISGGKPAPGLNVFFVRSGGVVSPPLYLDIPTGYNYPSYTIYNNPVTFHPSLPLIYAGWDPISISRYSIPARSVELTSQTLQFNDTAYPSRDLGHSPWSNTLVFSKKVNSKSVIQTVKINADGSFGQLNPSLTPGTYYNGDFEVTRDGRWAAAITQISGEFCMIRIAPDGSLSLVNPPFIESWDPEPETSSFTFLTSTPDSRRLLIFSEAAHVLISYDINPVTGQLWRVGEIERGAPGWTMSGMRAPAVTPDSRFAVFVSHNPSTSGHMLIHVVRIHEDGRLEYLPGKTVDVDFHICNLGFAPIFYNAARDWMLYE